jgi:uncharacterized protein
MKGIDMLKHVSKMSVFILSCLLFLKVWIGTSMSAQAIEVVLPSQPAVMRVTTVPLAPAFQLAEVAVEAPPVDAETAAKAAKKAEKEAAKAAKKLAKAEAKKLKEVQEAEEEAAEKAEKEAKKLAKAEAKKLKEAKKAEEKVAQEVEKEVKTATESTEGATTTGAS